jgi:hypothetical protein
MNVVTVYRTFNPADADLVASLLEAAGIEVDRVHDTASRMFDGYARAAGGIRLNVPEDQAADAAALIENKAEEIPPPLP